MKQVEGEAAAGGRHLGDNVQRLMREYRERQASLSSELSPAVAALLHTAALEQKAAQAQAGPGAQ